MVTIIDCTGHTLTQKEIRELRENEASEQERIRVNERHNIFTGR